MVMAINVVFKEFMMWPIGDKMKVVMMELKNGCGMRSVISVDEIHIAITKPYSVFFLRYYYHKTRSYNIVAQVMIDNQKYSFAWECE
jgi:hypothetical protein